MKIIFVTIIFQQACQQGSKPRLQKSSTACVLSQLKTGNNYIDVRTKPARSLAEILISRVSAKLKF